MGFVAVEEGLNSAIGRPARCTRYRISDNYTRFYLKYMHLAPSVETNGYIDVIVPARDLLA